MALTKFPIEFTTAPATTPQAVIKSLDGKAWNTSGTPALEAYSTAHYANYAIQLTQLGSGRSWYLAVPSTLPAGAYSVTASVPLVTATPVEATDVIVGIGPLNWDGSNLVELGTTPAVNVTQFGGTVGTFSGGFPFTIPQGRGKTYYVAGNAYGTITLSSPTATITLAFRAGSTGAGTEGNGVKTIVVAQNASESTSYNAGTDALTVNINISGGHNTVQSLINVINAGTVCYAWPLTGTTSTISTSTTGSGTLAKGVDGSDSNSGLTRSAPLATPLAATLAVSPADKVQFFSGAYGDVIVATSATTWGGEGDDTLLHNVTLSDVDGVRLLHFRVDGSQTSNLHGIVATNFSSTNYRTLYIEGVNSNGDDDGLTVGNCRWLEIVGGRFWGHNGGATMDNITGRVTGSHFTADCTFNGGSTSTGVGVRCQASAGTTDMVWDNCRFYPQRAAAGSNPTDGFRGCGHHTFIGSRLAPAATHASNTGQVNGIIQDASATGLDSTLIGCSFLGTSNSGSGATKQVNTSVSATKVRLSGTPYTASLLGTGVETDSISTPGETLAIASGKISPANGSITGSTFDGSTAFAQTGDSYAATQDPTNGLAAIKTAAGSAASSAATAATQATTAATATAAIKPKTDQLTFTTPNVVDATGGGGSSGGPIQQQPVGNNRVLQVKDRGDGTFGVIGGGIHQAKSEEFNYALEFKGTQLAQGQNLYGMSQPTVSGAQAAHATIGATAGTDYGVDHTQAKFLLTTTSGATAGDAITVNVTVQLTPTQTITVDVPVSIGS